jgi:hypothetical protein
MVRFYGTKRPRKTIFINFYLTILFFCRPKLFHDIGSGCRIRTVVDMQEDIRQQTKIRRLNTLFGIFMNKFSTFSWTRGNRYFGEQVFDIIVNSFSTFSWTSFRHFHEQVFGIFMNKFSAFSWTSFRHFHKQIFGIFMNRIIRSKIVTQSSHFECRRFVRIVISLLNLTCYMYIRHYVNRAKPNDNLHTLIPLNIFFFVLGLFIR